MLCSYIRIVKIQGEFTWHWHADTDEFFLVLDGELTIYMGDRNMAPARQE
jgi:mannose-6-phosphate isomerase-like protein (cupin superfamily)